jgi:hypothetical protein
MQWLITIAAILGAVTGTIALVWNVFNERRKVEVQFLGSTILLINHTRRPVNIDSVGFIYRDGKQCLISEPTFDSICRIPPEDQKHVEVGIENLFKDAKYAYARDICGKTYRSKKISRHDIDFFLQRENVSE